MFFAGDRIDYVRQMILGSLDYKRLERELNALELELSRAASPKKRKELQESRKKLKKDIEEPKRLYKGGLSELLKLQRKDFEGIFKAMNGLPVTIRTLDPPLHEFLPHSEEETRKLARKLKVNAKSFGIQCNPCMRRIPCLAIADAALALSFRK